MDGVPVVRITVDRMQQHMQAALLEKFDELGKDTVAALDKAVREFDWNAEVQEVATKEIREAMRRMVADCVRVALSDRKLTAEIAELMGKRIAVQLAKWPHLWAPE